MKKGIKNAVISASKAIECNHSYLLKPDTKNNIEIKNNVIKCIRDGKVIKENSLHISENILYEKSIHNNIFKNSEFSPLEADKYRSIEHSVWKKIYKGINFPKFMTALLIATLDMGDIPSFVDFLQIYLLTYTEEADIADFNPQLYSVKPPNYKEMIGEKFVVNDFILTNKIIKFKKEFEAEITNLPQNLFTTEQLCCRLYKVYFSIVRDIANVINLNKYSIPTYYSLLDDLNGIDMTVYNHIPIYNYTKTKYGTGFRGIKETERHKDYSSEIGIHLTKKTKVGDYNIAGKKEAEKIKEYAINPIGKLFIEY